MSLRVAWFASIFSLMIVGFIETAALHQPTTASRYFVHPHRIKGHIRYFSDREERVYRIAKPLMIGSFAVSFVLIIICGDIQQRRKWRETQELLRQFAQRTSE